MSEDDASKDILKRLNVIVALLVEQTDPEATIADRVARLSALGLGASEIGGILGRSSSNVSAVLSNLAKQKSRAAVRGR